VSTLTYYAVFLVGVQGTSCFNCNDGVLPGDDGTDGRSDDKGGEPEAIEVFTVEGRTFAAVGLERQSSIVVYEVRKSKEHYSGRKALPVSIKEERPQGEKWGVLQPGCL